MLLKVVLSLSMLGLVLAQPAPAHQGNPSQPVTPQRSLLPPTASLEYTSQPAAHSRDNLGESLLLQPSDMENYPTPLYSFGYTLRDENSGNHLGHSESREGGRTEGKYFVHLPDGRTQIVTYYVDETGYHASVSYEGEAHYGAPPDAVFDFDD